MSGFVAPRLPFGFLPRVKAVLGPTNTGKTHLAIERLLAHSSGIIGFPLRLLARENYDRMAARKGVRSVALITGEEKIVPPEARWFSCTVEAMPLDHEVEFIAVDEIQLCADPDRGHVFTERLLHARGLSETMFLGAETIRPLLSRLVPGVEIETRPRLSQLEYAGAAKLTKLPPRSAIVAFSAAEVYAIAELIRRRRGGCAVVMGRLSPRTRNAQVALYQAKEVDFLVATDAIGMGLNMDVDHVAFAGLGKHDGHRPRRLTAPEVAQIAGRAGRGMRDGTFGSTGDCQPLPAEIVDAVERHSFDRLEQLFWRNCDLDYTHVDALLESLMAAPTRPGLIKGNDASDLLTLATLIREPDIRRDANSTRRVRKLWEACQIPDFRKLADETHSRLCARVFAHSARDEYVQTDWLAGNIAALNKSEGDIDTLMQRLAGVRVWTYIAARSDWVRDAEHWQAQAGEVEDKLSDALHERLMSRFVDRRAAHLMRKLEEGDGKTLLSAVTRKGEVVVEGHPVGHVGGFRFRPDPMSEGASRKLVLRAARRALRESIPLRVGMLETALGEDFTFTDAQEVIWDGEPVARLVPGHGALAPRVIVLDSEFLDGPLRERVRQRLQLHIDTLIRTKLLALFTASDRAASDGALRGQLHRLRETLGLVPGATETEIPPPLRTKLKLLGVRAGRFALFIPALLKPRATALRARLWAVQHGHPLPSLAPPGRVSMAMPADWPPGFAAAMGWIAVGPVMLRLDIAEQVAALLAHITRRGPAILPAHLPGRLGITATILPTVLRALGFRLIPAPTVTTDFYGPPASPMLAAVRYRRAESTMSCPALVPANNAFAALAVLRS
ncbi:MAG: DNA helicase [Acetobacteraceae bacterium]|nr:DNA helicase [Acetobacteraceae bacterium]MSP29641.1 DNA helicase [Acetobacteraceae bacterium]